VLKQIVTLASGSVIGKLLGVVRELLFAAFFGTSAIADAYRAALTAILAPVHFFSSETLNAAFVPQFQADRAKRPQEAWALCNGVSLSLLVASLIVAGVLYTWAPGWTALLFPGFTADRSALVVPMLRIMACGVPLYVLSSLCIAVAIGSGYFRLPALRPGVQNVGVMIALVAAFAGGRPVWIAWGFTGTYVLFVSLGLYWVLRRRILAHDWYRYWQGLRPVAGRFWTAMRPITFFSLCTQGNLLLEKAIASLIGPGAVATVEYARLIPETVQVFLGVPLGLVSLSAMVDLDASTVREHSDRMATVILLLLVPLSGLVFVASPDIIRLLYWRGAFDEKSVLLTSQALRGMAVGLWAVCLSYILQRIYNARSRNVEVLRIGVLGLGVAALFNLAAYRFLGVLALGLGFSLGRVVMTWQYLRGIGGMPMVWRIGKLCLYGMVPYVVVALALQRYAMASLVSLTVQVMWTVLCWGSIFWIAPESRHILRQLVTQLLALRVQK
jgi:putative peptidoglycan lipid II flippase